MTRISTSSHYLSRMGWSSSSVRPAAGFIEPCLPTTAKAVPAGAQWIYEIKHDGYRLMVRKAEDVVRIYTRRGADWTRRFPRIVEAVHRLRARSILIDGEGVTCDDAGLAIFDLLHSKQHDEAVTLCAFDLLELDGEDFRPRPLQERKARLAKLLARPPDGMSFNPHLTGDGPAVFEHACALGCEGIVAKRLDLPYQSGRSTRWLKIKNPSAPAARRAEDGTF